MSSPTNKLTTIGRNSDYSQELGRFAEIMSTSPAHANLPIHYIRNVIIPSIKHRQYAILFNERGRSVSYLIWAMLADDMHVQAIKGAPWELHPCEWNEGENLWIVDFVAPYAHARIALREYSKIIPPTPEVYYRRSGKGRVVAKCISLE